MKLNLTPFIYEDHLTPEGTLPREHKFECSAAWHFAKLAMRIVDTVPAQVTMEDQIDQTTDLLRVAKSVALLYGLNSLADMMQFIPEVEAEARRSGLPWNPRLTAWVESGGRSYNTVTREESVLNIQ